MAGSARRCARRWDWRPASSLLLVCELRVARNYAFTANAMDGAGIAILYATLFAMHALWHLLPASAVFVLMLIVTAIAVLLSIRRDSVFIALLGLVGGFATPALLSTGENKPVALFSYLLLLNVGLLWVAIQRRWPLLTALSVVFTVIYEWSWIGKYFTARATSAGGVDLHSASRPPRRHRSGCAAARTRRNGASTSPRSRLPVCRCSSRSTSPRCRATACSTTSSSPSCCSSPPAFR